MPAKQIAYDIDARERYYLAVESRISDSVITAGLSVDYLTIVNTKTLAPAGPQDTDLVAAVAAKLGSTRLIDNISLAVVRDR